MKKRHTMLAIAITALACLSSHVSAAENIKTTDLRCEYLAKPLGIEVVKPRLSWVVKSDQRGQKQTAYQVLVASSRDKLDKNTGDLWDSGKVQSDQSIHVAYNGKPMESRMRCHWKVRVWDKDSKVSNWSEPAEWSMGLLKSDDWQGAKWIGIEIPKGEKTGRETEHTRLPARYLRRDFKVNKPVKSATAYVCGLGEFDFFLNGKKVGDHERDPGRTEFNKRALYVTFDVKDYLQVGNNAVGAILGNGRFFAPRVKVPVETKTFGTPRLLLNLQITYQDGTTDNLVSSSQWRATDKGPIRHARLLKVFYPLAAMICPC